jgi:chemotaxis protein methyltransferase CheR
MNSSFNKVGIFSAELSTNDFNRLSKFIMTEYGIKMPPEKKVMLQGRLQRRLKALNMQNFKEYVEYVFSSTGQSEEVIHMMDVVSTNKTDFFREPLHFDFLLSEGLPELVSDLHFRNLSIWSAGSSSGEEAYTISIVLSEFIEKNPGLDFTITASDISTQMLKKASEAVYHEDRIADVPLVIKKKYFLRSKDREEKKVKVITSLRSKVSFYRQNLLDLPQASKPEHHIIFCRNVLIYFNRENQFRILNSLCSYLKTGGYLFLGHSESITGFELPLKNIRPTIFRKKGD